MLFLFDLMYCLGYFLVMIIFMVVAIVIASAKSKAAWGCYVIGAVIQLLSLVGNQKIANVSGTNTTLHWVVYFGLLIISAILVVKRYNKAND